MTEREWLASTDPQAMLAFVTQPDALDRRASPSERKLRLFACACRRFAGNYEWTADGWGGMEEYPEKEIRANNLTHGAVIPAIEHAYLFIGEHHHSTVTPGSKFTLALAADLLRDIVGNPYRPVELPAVHGGKLTSQGKIIPIMPMWWDHPAVFALAQAAYDERACQRRQCPLCEGHSVGKLLHCRVCDNRGEILEADGTLDPFRLALLADALEEAGCPHRVTCHGCDNESGYRVYCDVCEGQGQAGTLPHPLLAHLRGGGSHVRGCWALDLLLGKG